MKDLIKVFFEILVKLNGDNLVLSGGSAIQAHGLNFRSPSDLDVSIYRPTKEQEAVLDTISALTFRDHDGIETSYTNDGKKLYKFYINSCWMDILIEKDSEPDNGLLLYEHRGIMFKVQSIRNIIAAKSRYKRDKDLMDFMNLKNNNFNYVEPQTNGNMSVKSLCPDDYENGRGEV